MSECCDLREANGIQAACDGEDCIYWRAVGHLGLSAEEAGCAIREFRMLEGADSELVVWLLSVKERLADEDDCRQRSSA